jgi:hypothetical protein
LKKILPVFSYIFHPIFISVFAVLYYFLVTNGYYNYETVYLYVIQTLIITVFIPIACFYLLVTLKKIDSIMVTNVSQRKIPLFIQILLCIALIIKSFTPINLPELFFFFLASIFSSAIALTLAFYHKKISLHMLGMASLTVFCVFCSLKFGFKNITFLSTLIALNGFVASSRLTMKAHTKTELILGFIIGAIPQIIILPLVYSI